MVLGSRDCAGDSGENEFWGSALWRLGGKQKVGEESQAEGWSLPEAIFSLNPQEALVHPEARQLALCPSQLLATDCPLWPRVTPQKGDTI